MGDERSWNSGKIGHQISETVKKISIRPQEVSHVPDAGSPLYFVNALTESNDVSRTDTQNSHEQRAVCRSYARGLSAIKT
jgi:hypothetical protein